MKDMNEIKTTIITLTKENNFLKSLNNEKDRVINELMYKVEQLEKDLEYSNVNGGLKKLILTNRNMIKYN